MSFGQNINQTVGQLEYINQQDPTSAPVNTVAITSGVTSSVIITLIVLLLMFSTIFYCYRSSVSKLKNEIEHAEQPVYV